MVILCVIIDSQPVLLSPQRLLPARITPLFSSYSALFGHSQNAISNPFNHFRTLWFFITRAIPTIFKHFRTLCRKHPGVGGLTPSVLQQKLSISNDALLFDFGSREEGRGGAERVFPQVKSRDSQAAVGVPAEEYTEQKKEERGGNGERQIEKRLPLEEQAPVCRFIPTRVDGIQELWQIQPAKRKPLKAQVCNPFVGVDRGIVRYGPGSLREKFRAPQIRARQHSPARVSHDQPIGRIDHDPAAVDKDFGDNVLGGAIGSQQKQPSRLQIVLPGEIQESVGGGAAHAQQLVIVESDVRIALRERGGVRGHGPRWLDAHPVQDALNLWLCRQDAWHNGVGKTVKVPANSKLAGACVGDGAKGGGKQ